MNERDPSDRSLALTSGYRIDAVHDDDAERLELRAPDGNMCLRITLTPEGPMVDITAASLAVRTEGDLRLDAGRLDVRAREGVALHTDGDLELRAGATLTTTAFEQRMTATHGDVRVFANDDVRIDGELIHLNSPEPHEGHGSPDAER